MHNLSLKKRMFITFEGIDHSGKSTHIKLLKQYFESKKKKVISVREPGGTEISEKIRDIILDKKNLKMEYLTEFLLFSASRQQLTKEIIIPHLEKNYIVLCDRYFDSSTAYQGYGGKVDLKIINDVNKIATCGLIPQKTFLFNISFEESMKRKKAMKKDADRIEQKKISYYNKVINGYLEISKNDKERFVVINGSGTIDEVQKKILKNL